jgi:hypothetical protein
MATRNTKLWTLKIIKSQHVFNFIHFGSIISNLLIAESRPLLFKLCSLPPFFHPLHSATWGFQTTRPVLVLPLLLSNINFLHSKFYIKFLHFHLRATFQTSIKYLINYPPAGLWNAECRAWYSLGTSSFLGLTSPSTRFVQAFWVDLHHRFLRYDNMWSASYLFAFLFVCLFVCSHSLSCLLVHSRCREFIFIWSHSDTHHIP